MVNEQLVQGRQDNLQWTLPDRLGNDAIADIDRICELDHEVARPQPAQMLGTQVNFEKVNLNFCFLCAAPCDKCRQLWISYLSPGTRCERAQAPGSP